MKIIDFCEKYDMIPDGGKILCAVSGGKDSVFLLHILLGMSKKRGFLLACAHFDHSLRGAESDRDRRFVEALCAGLGVACHVGKEDVAAYAAEKGLGTEEAARILRYAFLEKTADETGASKIATAHTADDNAETLLLNLARGSSLRGLCGIPPVRGRIIRPLLETSSREILEYMHKNSLEFVEDSTNTSDDYARNRLRHHVIPALRAINAGFDENAARCISLLREDERYLTGLAEAFIKEHFKGNCLPAGTLAALPPPVAARVLQGVTKGALSYAHISAVMSLASGERVHAAADVPGLRIRREYDRLIFGGGNGLRIAETPLIPGETRAFPEAGIQITTRKLPSCEEINNSDNTFFFQHDSICGSIFVRPRKEGDSIRLLGRNGTKTLKKLFSETKRNGAGKNLIPVICDENGPVAVYGFGIAQRCAAKPGDDVIYVQIEKI